MGRPFVDLTGQRFGSRVVLEFAGRYADGQLRWRTRCDCGSERIVFGFLLVKGQANRCMKCATRGQQQSLRHGHALHGKQTGIWTTWQNMLRRCQYPKHPSYRWYGAVGVRVCDRWQSFDSFLVDMGPTWWKGATIDRIDPFGNYEPSNCEWTTRRENASRPKRKTLLRNGA